MKAAHVFIFLLESCFINGCISILHMKVMFSFLSFWSMKIKNTLNGLFSVQFFMEDIV